MKQGDEAVFETSNEDKAGRGIDCKIVLAMCPLIHQYLLMSVAQSTWKEPM